MSEGRLDPVTLSVLTSALAGISEEMGAVLIRGSYSSNIKERRDCSTALFDAKGRMVAQAEHIPVHLGAMPEAVAAIMRRDPEPGDVFAINDPYSGGTHLPDITLVSPVALEGEILGYAVTRAHHSDVAGCVPAPRRATRVRSTRKASSFLQFVWCGTVNTSTTCSTSCSPTSARRL